MLERDRKSIVIIILWFGPWPAWIRLFLESCRWNPSVDWLIIGDAAPLEDIPPNVRLQSIAFDDYRAFIAQRLKLTLKWSDSYKLCDLRPLLGFLHASELSSYDYWGFGDLDVIYGDIRSFYTPDILQHDIISTHDTRISGHLVLLKNTPKMANAFRKIPFWRTLIASARHKSFDETYFSRLFLPKWGRQLWRRLFAPTFLGGGLFVERFSTNIAPLKWIDGSANWPERWLWQHGRLTTDRTPDREFLYVHFSNWNSARWSGESVAPWKRLARLVNLDEPRPEQFAVSAQGFTPV